MARLMIIPGLYEVSNIDGKVRNVKTGRLLKPETARHGYLRVVLCKNRKHTTFSVHRLVAQVFIPNPDNLPVVNHINEDKTDNRVENLEWSTYKHNSEHSLNKKVRCIETKRVFDSIQEASNWYQQETGGGVITSMISRCCKGKKKTAGGFHWEYVD